jgi:hypothetical protein
MRPLLSAMLFLLFLAPSVSAQACKVTFAIAHWDGKTVQVGLSPDQAKFWNREKAKRYSGLCLSGYEPDFVIAWSENSSAGDLTKLPVRRGAGKSNPEAPVSIPLERLGDAAHYAIYDLSKTSAEAIHSGTGSRQASAPAEPPMGRITAMPEPNLDVSRTSTSIADPTEAMRNALDWLKKKK